MTIGEAIRKLYDLRGMSVCGDATPLIMDGFPVDLTLSSDGVQVKRKRPTKRTLDRDDFELFEDLGMIR